MRSIDPRRIPVSCLCTKGQSDGNTTSRAWTSDFQALRIGTSYRWISPSRVTSVNFSTRAWATSIRSKGSRWIAGNRSARSACAMEIGKALRITEETTKVHVRNILEKLNVRDRTEAVTMALRRGIIHLY